MDSNNDQLIPIRELQMAKERVIIKNHPRLKENQKNEQLLEISKREENLKQYIKLKNYLNSTKVRNR